MKMTIKLSASYKAAFAFSAICANVDGSATAKSARTLRSRAIAALLRPAINRL